MKWILAIWSLAVGVVFVASDPAGSLSLPALESFGKGISACFLWVGAAVGAGGWAAARLQPDAETVPVSVALVLGIGLASLVALPFAAFGLLKPAALLPILLSLGWLGRPKIGMPALGAGLWSLVAAASFFGLLEAWAPAVDTDAVYYHLSLPKQMWLTGGLLGGEMHPNGSRPMLLHLPLSLVFGWGGETACSFFLLALSALLLAEVCAQAEKRLSGAGLWAFLLLAGSWTWMQEMGITANNLPTAFACFLCAMAARNGRFAWAGCMAGIGLGLKFSSAGILVGILLFGFSSASGRIRALGWCLPWLFLWLSRNVLEGLHPLFPFTGWELDLPFQHLEKYGMGRDLISMLMLPWNAVVLAETDSYRFMGRLSPLWLASLPAAACCIWKRPRLRWLAGACSAGLLFWAVGPHWLRHLLVCLPLLVLLPAVGMAAQGRVAWVAGALVWLAGLPANWGPLHSRLATRVPVALGQVSAEEYRSGAVEGWSAVRWASDRLPSDAYPALLFCWAGLAMDRPFSFGSVEDHVPSRHWLLLNGEESLPKLRSKGITHLVVGDPPTLRKSYPFLSDSRFQELFLAPATLLDEQLLRHAVMLYSEAGFSVYRLRAVDGKVQGGLD
jgi:hypothetical protein